MNTSQKVKQEQFYLASVDILQGISVLYFIIWHTMLWWDHYIDSKWPNVLLTTNIFMTTAMVIPPLFFFLYGFNVVNSLLQRTTESDRNNSRTRLIKRTLIFFIIAEFAEGATALVTNPKYLINYLLTWELFHLFSLTTIFLLLIFELAWKLEYKKAYDYRKVSSGVLIFFLGSILAIFLLIHDYSSGLAIEKLYVDLTLDSILKRAMFEYGQNPVIPWLSFPIIGGITANFLDLPHEQKKAVGKKLRLALLSGVVSLVIGTLYLGFERYISTAVYYPASSSFVFISIGTIILSTTILILFIDLNSSSSHQTVLKIFSPLILISKISLTVFIIHNVVYIIPPQTPLLQVLIFSETAAMTTGFIYSIFFIVIAFFWQKRSFKFSLEWTISKLQKAQWRWWINNQREFK
ncbi:MAG: hypothetical protein ACFFB5_08960 [Promethearchaeota archaeon]